MKTTIGIIGVGAVGSSIAISLLHSGLASEILLYDNNQERAEGEALDLSHGASFYSPCRVRLGRPEEMLSADAVVITAGRGGKAGESRLDLLHDNVGIIRELGKKFKGAHGLMVLVSNPVDIMTLEFQQASGLPPSQVIGTGTMLDTARLRHILGRELRLEPRTIHAQVVGEHGDSEVILWSGAQLGGLPLRQWPEWQKAKEQEIAREVQEAAQQIIKRKGATNHAIGLVTANLLKWALRGESRILTVSRVQEGAFGLKEVALSLPSLVGRRGVARVLEPSLDDTELRALLASAEKLRETRSSLE